jgi:hypothetical protein
MEDFMLDKTMRTDRGPLDGYIFPKGLYDQFPEKMVTKAKNCSV